MTGRAQRRGKRLRRRWNRAVPWIAAISLWKWWWIQSAENQSLTGPFPVPRQFTGKSPKLGSVAGRYGASKPQFSACSDDRFPEIVTGRIAVRIWELRNTVRAQKAKHTSITSGERNRWVLTDNVWPDSTAPASRVVTTRMVKSARYSIARPSSGAKKTSVRVRMYRPSAR